MTAVLIVIHSLVSVFLVVLVLLHSGRDAGLSGAFGVGGGASAYGGSTAIVERNLTRLTVAVGIVFCITTFFLVKTI